MSDQAATASWLRPFSRITSGGRRFIPQIDGLRFVAILAVIAYHVRGICLFHFGKDGSAEAENDFISKLFNTGHLGVPLFFAISGFILSLPFARQRLQGGTRIGLKEYFLRRVTRIEPPYVIHLFFLLLLCVLVYYRLPSHQHHYGDSGWWHFVWTHLLASLVYANGLIFGAHPYPNVVLWSLEVEVQFYLLAPFLASLFFLQTKWHRRTLMIVSILAFSFLETFFGLADYRIGFSLLGNLQYFLVGFLLADLYLARWLDVVQPSLAWDALALVGSLIVFVLHPAPALTPILPWILLACCVAAFKGPIASRCLSNAWITTMGGMCYTIYLYHSLLISTAIRLTKKLNTGFLSLDLLLQLLLITPIIIAICSVLFLLLERPFMRRSWPADLRQFVRSKLN